MSCSMKNQRPKFFSEHDVSFSSFSFSYNDKTIKVIVSLRVMPLMNEIHMRPVFKQVVDNRRVRHGCHITYVLVILCNLPQNSAHDLARACLWKPRWILNDVRGSKGSNLGTNYNKTKVILVLTEVICVPLVWLKKANLILKLMTTKSFKIN